MYKVTLSEKEIKEGWELHWSQREKKPYFYNRVTGQSKWIPLMRRPLSPRRQEEADRRRANVLNNEALEILERWGNPSANNEPVWDQPTPPKRRKVEETAPASTEGEVGKDLATRL